MKVEVLLDWEGTAAVPEGYQMIDTEVAFLEHATDDIPLLIRGQRLCTWAETYYQARRRPVRAAPKPLSIRLRETFPGLSQAQAEDLAQRLAADLDTPLSAEAILSVLHPDSVELWQQTASPGHAARWLVWLYEHQPDETEQVILGYHAQNQWRRVEGPQAKAYQACNKEQALAFLEEWLGIAPNEAWKALGAFPAPVPQSLQMHLRPLWRERIIDSAGECFEQILWWPLPSEVRHLVAEETAQYYRQHPDQLTRQRIQRICPYLTADSIGELQGLLKPDEPVPVPEDPDQVVDWFCQEYLPYRLWQQRSNNQQAAERVQALAKDFALWYLRHYPEWVLARQHLSFHCVQGLGAAPSNKAILVVVLDGLAAWDAQDLVQRITSQIERLAVLNHGYTFAPLPTITEFAKDALLKGMPPDLAAQYEPLGPVMPEDVPLERVLEFIGSGRVCFWRVQEPDRTYHTDRSHRLRRNVLGVLDGIVSQLADIVGNVPDKIILQVIITSDHGRLLNSHSARRLRVPAGMQSHGRAAWGQLQRSFGPDGFEVDMENQVVYVFGGRFQLSADLLVPLSEDTFLTNDGRHGQDSYPHGGLFPEEVIVPWIVMERDVAQPSIELSFAGSGEAGKTGTLKVAIKNLSDLQLTLLSVRLDNGARANGEWSVPPRDRIKIEVRVGPWPTQSQVAERLISHSLFRRPDGRTFELEKAVTDLTVLEMYRRDTSLLKDLDL